MNDYEKIRIDGEPSEVTEIRDKILSSFKGLEFVEDGHRYYLNGTALPSVSKIIERFEYPTDWDVVATNYALKHGETKDYWLDKWKFNSLKSTTSGTLVHEYGESLGWLRNGHVEKITESCKPKYVKDKNWLIPTRPKEEAILSFWDNIDPRLHFVLAEAKVYNTDVAIPYCGTFDLLMYYKDDNDSTKSGPIIMDYKTNGSLSNDYARENGKMMLPPFSDLYDESLSHYILQQSAYSLALRGIGLDIKGIRLIWLKDDGTYELVPIKDLSKENWFREVF